MKDSPHLRLSLFVIAILTVILLAGGWSAPLSAAEALGADLRPAIPSAASPATLLAVADTTLKSGFPNANFGGADTLDLEYAGGGRNMARILLRFNLDAGLPSGAFIDSAQLQMRLNSGTGVSPITVRASKVTTDWSELSVTWDTAPLIADPRADAQVGTAQGWVTWDVTAIARAWQTGRNYGLELRGPESGADWYRTFRSRHPVEAEPRLVVTYSFQETTPPSNPTSFTADHSVNQWSNNASISGHWDGASDGAGSGVYGYSVEWNGSPATVPDAVVDTTTNQHIHQLANGSWYLHVRTRDVAGNWNAGASHFGPYKIDTVAPTDPTITSASHTPNAWSVNPSVVASWSGASDGAGSGVAGYSILWDAAASTLPDTTVDTTGSTASSTRPDGVTYFHLRTKDVAGNWTATRHFGPLKIDTTPPTNPHSFLSDHFINQWSNNASISGHWDDASDGNGSGVSGYSFEWSTSLTTVPDAVVDTTTNQHTHQLANGSWYLHVRTRDVAGHWNAGAAHFGPYLIDATPPTNPTLSSSTHTPGAWSKNPAIHLSWTGASDGAGSGVMGYAQFWDDAAITDPGTTVNTTSTSATSTRYDGVTYFHLRTRDAAGNWSAPIHFGPLKIDTVAPTTQINAPAQVTNKTFSISWSGSDATSGAHFYEVRYRDITVGTYAWQTLKAQTITTGASFTGQDGHKYVFQARATDYAGNVQAWSAAPTANTAIATVDFSAIGLEVTQAVQDLNNSVPLVEGKRTFARFHVKSASGDHGPVSAQLNLYRNGQFVQAIMASNPNGTITVRQNPDRGQLQDSFYFDLPASWLNGTITLEGRISSGWAQTDPNNDTATATITFTGVPPLRVWILDMCYTWNGTDHDVPWADIDAITSYLRRMYPISNLVVPGVAILTPCLSAWQGEQQNLDDLALIRQSWALTRPRERVYGVFSNDYAAANWGCAGGLSYVPSTIATGVTGPTPGCYSAADQDGTWGDEIAAHELGHALGRPHAPSVDSPLPYCAGQEAGRDAEWPKDHTQGNISPTTSPTSPAAMYGFDIETLQVYPPTWKDIMSYCSPQWISDYTWKKIQKQLLAEAEWWQAQSAVPAGPPQDYLVVSGKVIMDTQQVQLGDFYHLTSTVEPAGRVPGEYSIRLLGAGGVTLANYPFTPQFNYPDYPSPGSGPLTALISEAVLWNPVTTRVAIYRGATEVAGRNVSPHTPVVTILAPHGGETFTGPFSVQWQASDGDNDPLTYLLQYSADGGATWRPLSGILSGRSVTVDPANLPGTTQGKFRVLASDGVNTGQDMSDGVFTMPDKAPAVRIESPVAGAHYIPGQPVALIGQAMDVEDGALTGNALQWTSSLSGALGAGQMLHVTDLKEGLHTITLTAQDHGGHRVEKRVTILVANLDTALYLPLLLR